MERKGDKKFWLLAAISFGVSVLGICLYVLVFYNFLEPKLLDLWFHFRGAVTAPKELSIVGIDERSFLELGIDKTKENFPRDKVAQALDLLRSAGAKGVAFDLIFTGYNDPKADQLLAEALKQSKAVIGTYVRRDKESDALVTIQRPADLFKNSAMEVANVTLNNDNANIRRFPNRVFKFDGEKYRSLAEAAAALLSPVQEFPKEYDFINYYGQADTIKSFPIYEVLKMTSEEAKRHFEKRVVIFGLKEEINKAGTSKDTFATPYSGPYSFGVEIQATIAANLYHKNWIRRADRLNEVQGFFFALFFACFVVLSRRPLTGGLILGGGTGLWAIGSYILFRDYYFFLPGLSAILLLIPTYGASILYQYAIIGRTERRTRALFSCYVGPAVLQKVIESGRMPGLEAENLEITTLFTDIANFTPHAKEVSAEKVKAELNDYFTKISEPILSSNGTIFQFIGDALHAGWGAPLNIEAPSDSALSAALNIKEIVEKSFADKMPYGNIRIGIDRGFAAVGNLGSSSRFTYTAVGDVVNLADRLQALNKYFGTTILISSNVVDDLKSKFNLLYLGRVCVKGRSEASEVFTVSAKPFMENLVTAWEQSLGDFRARNWLQAKEGFEGIKASGNFLSKGASLYLNYMNSKDHEELEDDWNEALDFDVK